MNMKACSRTIFIIAFVYSISHIAKYQNILALYAPTAEIEASVAATNTTNSNTNSNSNSPRRKIAEDIVQKAYNSTFANIVKRCPKEIVSFRRCMLQSYQEDVENAPSGGAASPEVFQHWWFRTMVRDAYNLENHKKGSLLWIKSFHVATASNPNVSMCLIEKIGTKQWKQVFRHINGKKYQSNGIIDLPDTSKEGYPSIVFFRDPLERFLSAYLDKCVDKNHRVNEKHCEPNQLFNPNIQSREEKELTMGLSFEDHQKEMFAAYVDVMPLRWNLHFFPQSLYCNGIYRFLDDYDFVGYMDSSFYDTLDKLGKKYGGRFEEELNKVFELSKQLNATKTNTKTTGQSDRDGVGKETRAVDKVRMYYTPRSLRRVLEYLSIDYVHLGMDIPAWAEEMLLEDEIIR